MKAATRLHRRRFLSACGALGAALTLPPAAARYTAPIARVIPASGESLPVIGMGSWITFHVGDNPDQRAVRVEILRQFFARGGAVIDSSPMYGLSEEVIGYCLKRLDDTAGLFSATKVWTPGEYLGVSQMKHSEYLWAPGGFDLMQIHNMVDWETHLKTLTRWKDEGRIRYMGVTTSHGRRHGEVETVLKSKPFDFVQITYNILDREAERRLLPLAADRGVAVIANRPFRRGELPDRLEGSPLPGWAREIDCRSWPQCLLKFIVSHPAITCAIPATSQVAHMKENMGAGFGRLPDATLRRRMARDVERLV